MITKDVLVQLLHYLQCHGFCKVYHDPVSGKPYFGLENRYRDLQIIDGDVIYHAEHGDYILVENATKSATKPTRVLIQDNSYISSLSISDYRSPRNQLPIQINEFTPLIQNPRERLEQDENDYNWSLFEYICQYATLFSISILNNMSLDENVKKSIQHDLASSDDIHPTQKIIEALDDDSERFEQNIIAMLKEHLSQNNFKDNNDNVIGNNEIKPQKVGPIAITITPTKDESSIVDACKVIGRDICLSHLSEWFTFLNKPIEKELLLSGFGLTIVTGALKQVGIVGNDTFITNEPEIIGILNK